MGGGAAPGIRPRHQQIRVHMCNACKQLGHAGKGTPDGFLEARMILAQIQNSVQPPITANDFTTLLDTEGDSQNGGGSFQLRKLPGEGELDVLVKWVPDGGEAPNQGRIGSIGPGVAPSNPPSANATPFGSLRGFSGLTGGAGLTGGGLSGLGQGL